MLVIIIIIECLRRALNNNIKRLKFCDVTHYFCYKVGNNKFYIKFKVDGFNDTDGILNSAEVFDYNTQEWHMISNMPTIRCDFGVGVLNNLSFFW